MTLRHGRVVRQRCWPTLLVVLSIAGCSSTEPTAPKPTSALVVVFEHNGPQLRVLSVVRRSSSLRDIPQTPTLPGHANTLGHHGSVAASYCLEVFGPDEQQSTRCAIPETHWHLAPAQANGQAVSRPRPLIGVIRTPARDGVLHWTLTHTDLQVSGSVAP